jgi:hypothetical protein
VIVENSPTFIFDNELVTFETYIDEFTFELYKEFDLKDDNLDLHSNR